MLFNTPATWREPTDHVTNCYFCMVDVTGYSIKYKKKVKYPVVDSVDPPSFQVLQANDSALCDIPLEDPTMGTDFEETDGHYQELAEPIKSEPQLFTRGELNDLVRDLSLTKTQGELLGSRLKERSFLRPGVHVSYFRSRDQQFRPFFVEEQNLTYSPNIDGLMKSLGIEHRSEEWRLFIDSSSSSLKAVLLHIGNQYPSIPIAYSTTLKEKHDTVKFVMDKIGYSNHQWRICSDLKMVALVLGLQLGYTKFGCFLCEWDSRDRSSHYIRKDWPLRKELIPGSKNVLTEPLAHRDQILLPVLHLKLGLVKNFVKKLQKDGGAFAYLKTLFPELSEGKIKEGVFVGPQIRKLMKNDVEFIKTLTEMEIETWLSLKKMISDFLGSKRAHNHEELIQDMLTNFKEMGVNMSLKIHFLHSHLDFFPENLVDTSEEHGERFHQDIAVIERRYKGKSILHMLCDYCWTLMSDDDSLHKRKCSRISFQNVDTVERRKTC